MLARFVTWKKMIVDAWFVIFDNIADAWFVIFDNIVYQVLFMCVEFNKMHLIIFLFIKLC